MADKNKQSINKYIAAAVAAAIVAFQSVVARMSGGGLGAQKLPEWLTWLPEVFFALTIGVAAGYEHGLWWVGAIASVWAYLWMQTGHGTAFHMGTNPAEAQGTRKQTLSIIVDPVCKLFNQPLGETFYCWLFMGLKGLLIHAPLGLYALPAALLWPLAYHIGRRFVPRYLSAADGGAAAELLSGAFSGLLIAFYILF